MAIKKGNTAIICLSPYSGGMEIDSIKLAKKLSKYIDITLIAKENCFIAEQKEQYLCFNNIKLETINFKSTFSLNLIKKAREIVKKNNIKNVIFFGASEIKSLYFSFLGLDISLIVRHGTTKSRPKKDFFHKLIYRDVNYHVCICKHLQKNVDYIIPFGKNTKSKLIYSSLEVNENKKVKSEKLTLVHVGRIAEAKGQYDAIKACEILYKNQIDFIFYLVGGLDSSYEKKFLELYNSLEYRDSIKLVGFTDNVNEYLEKSDVFLFPSHGEGLSNSFLEALSYNLICISYDNTSFPELKELGLDFIMARNRDINDLKNKLLFISKNINNENIKNYIKIKEIFSLKKEINNYLEILK